LFFCFQKVIDQSGQLTTAALATFLAQQQLQSGNKLSTNNMNLQTLANFAQQQQQLRNQQQQQQQQSKQGSNNISPSSLMMQQQIANNSSSASNVNNSISSTNQETFIQPILGVAPLGKTPLTKEQTQQLIILEQAAKKMPKPGDMQRVRNYLPQIPVNIPSYYPMSPPNGYDSPDFLSKLPQEALFFMFYYMEVSDELELIIKKKVLFNIEFLNIIKGTKAQFLAAQALKKLMWRFHTRYMMWFQRSEEPEVITDEYENVN
jgi:CCR4-NOT transcription complex subunit 3